MSALGYLKKKDITMLLKIRKKDNENQNKKMNKWASIGKCTKNLFVACVKQLWYKTILAVITVVDG